MTSRGKKQIKLALQGGGSHGAVTWGALDRLLEDDRFEIVGVSGASAGAVNAVALAYGLHQGGAAGARAKLDELWATISAVGAFYNPVKRTPLEIAANDMRLDASMSWYAFDAFTRLFSPYQFNPFNINPLRDVLEKVVDFADLRGCTAAALYISATNVRTGKVRLFNADDVTLDAVLASTCLPFLFKAVEIGGEHYWDGGYMGNPSLYPFFYDGKSNDVVIVHVNPLDRDDVPMTAPEILNRVNEISFNGSLLRELRAIAFVEKLLDEKWIKKEYRDRLQKMRIHSIRSDKPLADLSAASKFSIDMRFLNSLKERGRRIADEWINENFDAVGNRSSVDIRAMFEDL